MRKERPACLLITQHYSCFQRRIWEHSTSSRLMPDCSDENILMLWLRFVSSWEHFQKHYFRPYSLHLAKEREWVQFWSMFDGFLSWHFKLGGSGLSIFTFQTSTSLNSPASGPNTAVCSNELNSSFPSLMFINIPLQWNNPRQGAVPFQIMK